MRQMLIVTALGCVFLLPGCIVPLPHVKRTCGNVSGTVVDAETNAPMAGARVRIVYPDGGAREARTDGRGTFRFPPKHRFHWGVVIGIALNYSLPYDCGWHDFVYITVKADGYRPVVFPPSREHPRQAVRGFVVIHPQGDAQGECSPMGGARAWHYSAIPLQSRAATQPASRGSGLDP